MKISVEECMELKQYLEIVKDKSNLFGQRKIAMAKYDKLWQKIKLRNTK